MSYPYFERKCPNCGMVYKESDLFCSKCGCELPKAEAEEEALVNGIEKSKWCAYIEKNTDRYMEIFKKNEQKKFFAFPNICAMLFGLYWLFYRKMFKEGAVFVAFNFILSLVLSVILLFAYQGELKANVKIIDDFNAYAQTLDPAELNGSKYSVTAESTEGSTETAENDAYIHSTVYSEKYAEALKAQAKIQNIATAKSVWGFFFNLLISIIFGLFADSIYRNHILREIKYSAGGVSVPAIFGALVITLIVNAVSNPISQLLTGLFIR